MSINGIQMIEPSSCRFTRGLYKYPHIHGDYELIFCISGEANAFIDKEKYHLTAGKGIFVFPNLLHLYETLAEGEFCTVVFKPENIPTFKKRLSRRVTNNPVFDFYDAPPILDLLENMRSNYDYKKDEYQLMLTGYINFLVYFVYSKMEFSSISHKDTALLEQMIEYCNQNYKAGVSVKEAAKIFLTNSNHISRVFNMNMKMGIPQYVESLRLAEACHLLENTDYSVAKVSEEAGFGSIRSMNRAFESFLGIAPRDYKREMINRKY